MIIAPSVLSLDYSDTKSQLEALNLSKATWLHFDVMDGHFVPNISFGIDVLKGIKKISKQLLDVHVMISDPKKYADAFIDAGAQVYTFHYEALKDDQEIIALANYIRSKGVKAGISIKPKTSIESIVTLLPYFDLILVMSVEPGFGGQKFDETSLEKISSLRKIIDENNYNCLIEVDGGINEETAKLCKQSGVDILVAGSYIFKGNIIDKVESLL